MFKKTHIASAIIMAVSCQFAYAQQEDNASVNAEKDDIEIIQVSGIRGSLNKALAEKRFSTQIVDSIIAEDIGKFPDNNVVEALQRVTGVQTTGRGAGEVSTVSIRGLTDVHTTVNGRDIFTGAGRDVALQDIPASLLSGVTVYKTRSADQVERGIAGSIDIKTNRPFNFDGQKVVLAARGIYSDQPDKVDPNISALLSNRWEIDGAGEFGALFNVSYSETNYRDDTITAGAAFPFFTNNPQAMYSPYSRIPEYDSQGNKVWQIGQENGLPNTPGSKLNVEGEPTEYLIARDAIFGTSFTGLRKRPAASISLQWAPVDTLEITAEGFYTGYENESQNAMWFSNTFENGNGNIETPTIFDGTNVVKEKQAINAGGFQSGDFSYGKTDSYLYALGAQWQASEYLTINTEVVYQESEFETDFFAMRFDRVAKGLNVDFNDNDGVPGIAFWDDPNTAVNEADMAAIQNWNAGTVYDNGGGNRGDSTTFTFDAEYLFGGRFIDKVKFGGRYEKRTAEEFTRTNEGGIGNTSVESLIQQLAAAGTTGDGSGIVFHVDDYFDGRADTFSNFVTADGGYMLDNAGAVRNVYGLEAENVYKTLDIEENSYALYTTTNFFITENISGEFGVRYVKYEQDMDFTAETGTNTNIFDSSSASADVSKLLPSLVLNWNITDDVIGRFAYTNTLRMPNFADLNALQYFTDPLTEGTKNGTGTGGNPQLQPEESTNYDISLEWYFADSSSLYATYFLREIDSRIVPGRKVVMRPDKNGDIIPYALSAPVNASEGELSGLELGLVYFPDNLPEMLNGLGLQASFTALDSSQKLPEYNNDGTISGYVDSSMAGVSDQSYSVVGIYERDSFDMRLSYVWRSEFYTGNEAAIFANPLQFWNRSEQSLDFQFSYDVTDDFVVTFDATNILDDVYQSYYGEGNENIYNFGNGIYSRTFAIGARYSF
ncbi:TonB-dependent receptor [Pseudoalteromonas sp. SG44-1]|uniref:TonB-dependent receptor n=1 Tax=unclassified Pseudoalteromonas TaxID=194690 RepID=UPI0016008258|nr:MULTISPECIES: TonB-dependent receptor [unclassified Pseudoalteromonas]MBB1417081.1 TonB-dependent receptor [Pseudoalteromonas sp. SG44-1]MBB1434319.1 TonB-dependent receptor [Pseudoalteromonas sp. SG43-6]MBB1480340.1 TonB-dependent receptor [Pseudoalteromonas sp. SG41-2]